MTSEAIGDIKGGQRTGEVKQAAIEEEQKSNRRVAIVDVLKRGFNVILVGC